MAWVRIHDGAMVSLKVTALTDSAFRLWVRGLSYCQTALTDGLIPRAALKDMGAKRKDVDMLSTPQVEGRSPLWEPHALGFKVHDYLAWNDCRDKVVERQDKARVRKLFYTDHDLRERLRLRDGDTCRYCGEDVSWTDRRGPRGATYDHVDPSLPYDQLSNLVVACRGCNSKKRSRTPEVAGMPLRPLKNNIGTKSELGPIKTPNLTKPNQTKPSLPSEESITSFETFWAVYPKHEGRKAALAWWTRLKPTPEFANTITAGAERYARKVCDWKAQYIKAPVKWLDGAHWEDELKGVPRLSASRSTECAHTPRCPNTWAHCKLIEAEQSGDPDLPAVVRRLYAKAEAS